VFGDSRPSCCLSCPWVSGSLCEPGIVTEWDSSNRFLRVLRSVCLLAADSLDHQFAIHGLRRQIAIDRMRTWEALKQASADLLGTMPSFHTFEDRLSIEFRRAISEEAEPIRASARRQFAYGFS